MKCWNTLFHCIQETVALDSSSYFAFDENPAVLLMTFLSYQEAIPYLHPLLFWHGDMSDIPMKVLTR